MNRVWVWALVAAMATTAFGQAPADKLTADSPPVEDVHYLIVMARLRGKWTENTTRRVADALLALDRKLTEKHYNRATTVSAA